MFGLLIGERKSDMVGDFIQNCRSRLKRELFLPTLLSVAISPIYIIRKGLYRQVQHLAPELKGDVLDFGCGSKPYESLFVNAKSYVGVDIAVSGHSHEKQADNSYKDSKVDYFYDGKRLPFDDNSFDGLVAFEVFEHVFNIDEVIPEIRRVMKPGSLFLCSTPFAWDEHEEPYDFARYTSFGMRHILEKHGFEVLEIKKTTTYVLAVAQMFIAYLARHVAPKSGVFRRLFQLVFLFPLNVLALIANFILPKHEEYFSTLVVYARKRKDEQAVANPSGI
jgi:SAM-dependent methyltransferase